MLLKDAAAAAAEDDGGGICGGGRGIAATSKTKFQQIESWSVLGWLKDSFGFSITSYGKI